MEFSDLECPFCAKFHKAILDARQRYGDSLAVVFVHYPLVEQHKLALAAARAAECAARQDHFEEFITKVYEKQDSLGLKTWSSFASEAGLRDTAAINKCATASDRIARIEDGREVGRKIGVAGTPTVIINGWRYAIPPYDSLDQILARLANPGKKKDSRIQRPEDER